MNEEPKNIWKQPWRGAKAVAWFAILIAATFLIVTGIGLLSGGNVGIADTLLSALAIALLVGVVALLVVFFVRCLCSWRNLKRLLFGVACLATLFALFHVVENVRGRAAWRKLQQEATAKGESFDLASIIPPSVPDDQNFAMASLFEGVRNEMDTEWRRAHSGPGGLTNIHRFTLTPYRTNGSSSVLSVGGWAKAERVNLRDWQRYYRDPKWDGDADWPNNGAMRKAFAELHGLPLTPTNVVAEPPVSAVNEFPTAPQPQSPAADVLLALSKYDPVIEELREAAKRPRSRFPVRYEDGFNALLPHLAKMKGATQLLALRALAELATDQGDRALADLKLAFRLADGIHDEPLLISQLVRIAQVQIALQPVWEGLVDHKWNETQLIAIEGELAKLDFLADHQQGMRGERAFSIWTVDYVRRAGDFSSLDSAGPGVSPTARFFFRLLVPGGWFDQNKVSLGRIHFNYIQTAVNPVAHTVSPTNAHRLEKTFESRRPTPYAFFVPMLIPALSKASAKAAQGQTSVDLTRIACALERYRLAQGSYPETLDALSPTFIAKLPHDVINGQPLKYRRTDKGQFVIYSVGWNETDDGGQVVLTKGSSPSVDWKYGDWVWRFPAK